MSGFSNPIAAGDGTLLVDAIKSPNYVLGASGWSINADGTAEFNNVSVRGSFEVIQQPGGGYMKMIPLQFSPGLVWNSTPSVFTKQGSLQVETIGLGLRATTRITTPSGTTLPTVDPEISITSGDTGTTGEGGIGLTAGSISLNGSATVNGSFTYGGTTVSEYQRGLDVFSFNGAVASLTKTITFPVAFTSFPLIWITIETTNTPTRFVYKIRGASTTTNFSVNIAEAGGAVVAAQDITLYWRAET